MSNPDSSESFDFQARLRQRANETLANAALNEVYRGISEQENVIELASLKTFRNGTLAEDVLDGLSAKSQTFSTAIDNFSSWDRTVLKDERGDDHTVKRRMSVCSFGGRDFWLIEDREFTGSGHTEAELNFSLSLVAIDPIEPTTQIEVVS